MSYLLGKRNLTTPSTFVAPAACSKWYCEISALFQSTESGSTGTPLRVIVSFCALRTSEAPVLLKIQKPPPSEYFLSSGASSKLLMPAGTPQDGWKITYCISAENRNVGDVGLPTTIFSDRTT